MRHPGIGLILVLLLVAAVRADDPPVSIADLAGYRVALAAPAAPRDATPATFRDLWEHPEGHQGRLVRVEGRLARLFRQPAVGQFPALAEGWITSPLGEPICAVFPTGAAVPATGAQVRFTGTFLRKITYAGGDAARVAPLIVGPQPPAVSGDDAGGSTFGPIFGGDHAADWGIGLAAALGVGWVLLRRHLTRPLPLAPPTVEPAPVFLDGGSTADPYLDDAGADADDDY